LGAIHGAKMASKIIAATRKSPSIVKGLTKTRLTISVASFNRN
jgi:hypothetical protein